MPDRPTPPIAPCPPPPPKPAFPPEPQDEHPNVDRLIEEHGGASAYCLRNIITHGDSGDRYPAL